jgi:hypothetical protein
VNTSSSVSLALSSNTSGASFTYTANPTRNGVATFSNCQVSKSQSSPYTLTATSGALHVTSSGFNVTNN